MQAFIQLGNSTNVDEQVVEGGIERVRLSSVCRKFEGANLSEVQWHMSSKSPKYGNNLHVVNRAFEQHLMRALSKLYAETSRSPYSRSR